MLHLQPLQTTSATSATSAAAPRCPVSRLFAAFGRAGLADELKARTKDAHNRAEHHPLQQRIVRGAVDRAEYIRFAASLRHIHIALERAIEGALTGGQSACPPLARIFRERHKRSAYFELDFGAFPSEGDTAPSGAALAMADWIRTLGGSCPVALVGPLYVLEGSTNGGTVIARVLRSRWGLEGSSAALRSIDPHGASTRAHWAEFRSDLDALALSREERSAIIAAASETFEWFTRLMDAHGSESLAPRADAPGLRG